MMTHAIAIILTALAAESGAADSEAAWRKVFERQPGISAVGPVSPFPGVDLSRPLLECPGFSPLKVDAVASLKLKIDLGEGKRRDVDVWIGQLPVGTRADKAVVAAAGGQVRSEFTCSLSMRGVSFLQIGRYWIGLPTLCRKGYYQGAVSVVLVALQRFYGAEFPSEFIFAPCGSMKVEATSTAGFLLKAARLPSNKPLQRTGTPQ